MDRALGGCGSGGRRWGRVVGAGAWYLANDYPAAVKICAAVNKVLRKYSSRLGRRRAVCKRKLTGFNLSLKRGHAYPIRGASRLLLQFPRQERLDLTPGISIPQGSRGSGLGRFRRVEKPIAAGGVSFDRC